MVTFVWGGEGGITIWLSTKRNSVGFIIKSKNYHYSHIPFNMKGIVNLFHNQNEKLSLRSYPSQYEKIHKYIYVHTDLFSDRFGTANGQRPFAVPNQSENSKYNLISGWFNKISKWFLCVCWLDNSTHTRRLSTRGRKTLHNFLPPLLQDNVTLFLLWCSYGACRVIDPESC